MRVRSMTRRAGSLAASIMILATAFAPAAAAATPSTFVVTTAADLPGSTCAAACSLRQAIGAANTNAAARDTIVFALAGGPADIAITTALPAITDPVIIDGTTQPGIRIVGTALAGTVDGFVVQESASVIRGLEIREFPGHGILLDGVHDVVIGGDTAAEGNVITRNGLDGVAVIGDATAVNNRITANRIFDNGALPIDLGDDDLPPQYGDNDDDTGPNGLQNSPYLGVTSDSPALQLQLGVRSRPGIASARVDVYWSASCPYLLNLNPPFIRRPYGGEVFEGSIEIPMTTILGHAEGSELFSLPNPRSGGFITATTTTPDGTSEMSECQPINTSTDIAVTGTVTPADPIDVGTPVTFDLVVSNLGPLPHYDVGIFVYTSGMVGTSQSASSGQGSCFVAPGLTMAALCYLGEVDPGSSVAVSVSFLPATGGLFGAFVVAQIEGDPDPSNNGFLVERVIVAADGASAFFPSGGSLTTDTELDGATNVDPIETTVTLPPGASGLVTIAEQPDPTPPPLGYAFAGQAVVINAPAATAANPLVFTFLVDASIAPPDPIVVFRNGVPVPDCSVANPLTDPSATPDPCVVSRLPVGDDVAITVRTSAASTWRIGSMLPFAFDGFFSPIRNGGTLNRVKAGSAVPVKFSLGGDRGLEIFAAGNPRSVSVACDGSQPGAPEATVTPGSSSLSYAAGSDRYTYVWKTNKAWAGTCRKLEITFVDGSTHEALFDFRK